MSEIPEDIWEKRSLELSEECKHYRMGFVRGHLRTSLPKQANIAFFAIYSVK